MLRVTVLVVTTFLILAVLGCGSGADMGEAKYSRAEGPQPSEEPVEATLRYEGSEGGSYIGNYPFDAAS
jgi:hypothetical protein